MLEVKITAANQEDLKTLYLIRNLYLSDEGKVDKDSELKLMRTFRMNYEQAQDKEDMIALKKRVYEYRAELKHCGVKDWELKTLDTSTFWNILILIKSCLFVLSFCTIVVLFLNRPFLVSLS